MGLGRTTMIKEENDTSGLPATRRGLVGTGAALLGWTAAPPLRHALVPATISSGLYRFSVLWLKAIHKADHFKGVGSHVETY